MVWENSCASHLTLQNSLLQQDEKVVTPAATLAVYCPLFGGGFHAHVFGLGKVDGDF